MKRIYTATDVTQAYLLSQLLARAGIGHYLANEHLQGGAGELPFAAIYPVIWLYDDAEDVRARRIVEDFERVPPGGDWRCTGCGEDNPSTFDLCWRCGVTSPLAGPIPPTIALE